MGDYRNGNTVNEMDLPCGFAVSLMCGVDLTVNGRILPDVEEEKQFKTLIRIVVLWCPVMMMSPCR